MFNNPYLNSFNQQQSLDRINEQIKQLESIKSQMQQPIQQPTNLTQNFQLAPSARETIKYANSMEDVQKEIVVGDTPFFSKDMSVVWLKNAKGEIRTYELNEIIAKDEKDMQIALLQSQIEELRREMRNYDANVTNVNATENATSSTGDDETTRTTTKSTKSPSIQRIPTSKKR